MTETVWGKAAEVLERYGWQQGYYGNQDDGYCAMGALRRAGAETWGERAGVQEQEEVLATQVTDHLGLPPAVGGVKAHPVTGMHSIFYDSMSGAVIKWNDNDFRTPEEVVTMFRELHEKELAERGELT